MDKPDVLYWFRQDLRLSDNPALQEAAARGRVLPIDILDDHHAKEYKMGAASRFWLHHSLIDLRQLDDKLSLFLVTLWSVSHGCASVMLLKPLFGIVVMNHGVWADTKIKASLVQQGIEVQTFNGSLLWEPWQVLKQIKAIIKYLHPFQKRCTMSAPPRSHLSSQSL